jgi:hypothetical protein
VTLLTLEAYSPNLVEKLSKKSGRPQNEGVRSLRNGAKGLISLRYAGDFCARDTTERLFRQFQKEISATFAFTAFSEVRLACLRLARLLVRGDPRSSSLS